MAKQKQKQIDRKYWEKYVYRYTMTVIEAYDGDTLVVNFDYGFKLKEGSALFRLTGIQSPELKDKGGPEAKVFLAKLCPPKSVVLVQTHFDRLEKYGRFIGVAWSTPREFDLHLNNIESKAVPPVGSVNHKMILSGHSDPWDGRNKK